MKNQFSFAIKQQMIELSHTCFWYWGTFYSFLESSGVSKSHYQRYPKDTFTKRQAMRNILGDLEERGQIDTINALISNFYRLKNAVDRDKLDTKEAKRLLQEFRDSVGNDPIETAIKQQQQEKARADYQESAEHKKATKEKLLKLNQRFLSLVALKNVTSQQRGFKLETLFYDLLHFAEFEYEKSYRTLDEQIDGHFKFEKFDYLVEVKWIKGPVKQEDMSIFDGKIRSKAQSTRGLFLAASGFDENAVKKYSYNSPRIILMTGEDLALILDGTISLFDVMKAKVDAIVRYGNINFSARNIHIR